MTERETWLSQAKQIADLQAIKKIQQEAERKESEKAKRAQAQLQSVASDMQFFAERLGVELTERDVVTYEGDWPVFRLDDTVNLIRKTNGAVVIYRRAGYETSNFASFVSADAADNVFSLMEAIARCDKWVDEQIAADAAAAVRKAEEERSRQSRVAAKRQSDAETAQAMAVKTPAITISSLYQMLWHVTRIRNVLICADKLTSPFQERLQLEALEMLRQLVDSANQVAAKLSAEREESDDGIPF